MQCSVKTCERKVLARKAWGWLSDDPEEEPPATKPKIPYLQDVPLEVADG